MFPKFLLNADDDWQESLRRYIYPRIHKPLSKFGSQIGINLYAVGGLWNVGKVGVFDESEESIEEGLDDRARRNPIACLKNLPDGRVSEGSWALLHEDHPELIEEGMQLHMTLFERSDGKSGREIHAHYEDDWRSAPLSHLRAKNFSYDEGVKLATEYINQNTHLILK